MKTLDELDRLEKAATVAPWLWEHNAAYLTGPQEDDGDYHGPIICGTLDKKAKINAEFIQELRNQARALIEVARAAEAFMTPWPEPGSKRHEALLEAVAALTLEEPSYTVSYDSKEETPADVLGRREP
jgi:hypothetical protein